MQRCIDLSGAVEYLHDRGIIHGDIKADNILVSDSGDVQLADFGNETLVEHITLIFTHTSPLPECHVRFTAPEILDDTIQGHTAKSDIYALGMVYRFPLSFNFSEADDLHSHIPKVILQILTGKLPYAEDSDRRALANIYRGILPPRPKLGDILQGRGVEDKLWSLLKRCWEHDPNLRPTATEVKQALIEIERESSTWSSD